MEKARKREEMGGNGKDEQVNRVHSVLWAWVRFLGQFW